jgi:hypothetical protein
MWQKVKKWLVGAGEYLWRFSRTLAAQFLDKYGPVAMDCVRKAAMQPGSGEEKFAYATACFMSKVPGASLYLVETAIQVAYAIYKEEQAKKD